jgi:hypothetical protein
MSEGCIKSRIISFRLSAYEHGTIEEASQKQGFASVALFARSATLECKSSESVHSPLDVEINKIMQRIEALATALETLTAHAGVALNHSL